MKLILITPPTYFVEEDKIITALFEEGLDTLHLRKPGTAPMFCRVRLLQLVFFRLYQLQELFHFQ